MKDENKNQNEVSTPLFTKGVSGYEYKGKFFKAPVCNTETLKEVAGGICLAVIWYCFIWLLFAAF